MVGVLMGVLVSVLVGVLVACVVESATKGCDRAKILNKTEKIVCKQVVHLLILIVADRANALQV